MVQSEVFNVSYGYPREQLALSVHRKKKKTTRGDSNGWIGNTATISEFYSCVEFRFRIRTKLCHGSCDISSSDQG